MVNCSTYSSVVQWTALLDFRLLLLVYIVSELPLLACHDAGLQLGVSSRRRSSADENRMFCVRKINNHESHHDRASVRKARKPKRTVCVCSVPTTGGYSLPVLVWPSLFLGKMGNCLRDRCRYSSICQSRLPFGTKALPPLV